MLYAKLLDWVEANEGKPVFVMDQLTTQKMVALRHFANYWAIRLLNSLGAVFIRTMLGRWIYCADRLLSC